MSLIYEKSSTWLLRGVLELHYPWDMYRNIHQDKKARYVVISVRVNVSKKVQLAQERVRVTMCKASGLIVQVGKLCGHGQVHRIDRSVYLFFCGKEAGSTPGDACIGISTVSEHKGD